nr:MAG TPA: hypothetical protein [Caudoviricetes sp.]
MEKSLRAVVIGFCLSMILVVVKFLGVEFTWQFVLTPFLIPLSISLVLIINFLVIDGIDDIKREMEKKRK